MSKQTVWQNIHPTVRGLWLCPRVRNRSRGWWSAPNSEAARRGYPQQATQGCGYWNVYVSHPRSLREGFLVRQVDTNCKHCSRRVKFQLSRQSSRGRPRAVVFTRWANDCPLEALIEEANVRNHGEHDSRRQDAFVTAKEYKMEE